MKNQCPEKLIDFGDLFLSCLKEKETVILLFDAEGTYIDASSFCKHLLYRPIEELVGRNVCDIFSEDLAKLCTSTINKSLKDGKCVSVEYPLDIYGKEIWFEGVCIPFTTNSVIWLAKDITEKKNEDKIILDACSVINNIV